MLSSMVFVIESDGSAFFFSCTALFCTCCSHRPLLASSPAAVHARPVGPRVRGAGVVSLESLADCATRAPGFWWCFVEAKAKSRAAPNHLVRFRLCKQNIALKQALNTGKPFTVPLKTATMTSFKLSHFWQLAAAILAIGTLCAEGRHIVATPLKDDTYMYELYDAATSLSPSVLHTKPFHSFSYNITVNGTQQGSASLDAVISDARVTDIQAGCGSENQKCAWCVLLAKTCAQHNFTIALTHSDVRFDADSQTANLHMYGQGTYLAISGLDFRCAFTVSWFDIVSGAVVEGCPCTIWWKALRTKDGNSLAVDCPCLETFYALNNLPQNEAVSLSDTVHRVL